MDQSRIAVRYAKALFELAQEKKLVERVKADTDFVAQVCALPEMVQIAESPVIKPTAKAKAFDKIFSGKVDALILAFLQMVVANRRERYIGAMCRNFASRFYDYANIRQVHITTAAPIDEKTTERLRKAIAELCKSEVEMTASEDPSLIGGFVLRIGDQQLDASVSSKLNNLKQKFTQTSIN